MKRKGARRLQHVMVGVTVLTLMLAVSLLIREIDRRMQMQELEVLHEQVKRAAVSCYASEGRYPQTLDYLVKHYGLVYDEMRYNILYDAFASNIMPDIDVMIRGDSGR